MTQIINESQFDGNPEKRVGIEELFPEMFPNKQYCKTHLVDFTNDEGDIRLHIFFLDWGIPGVKQYMWGKDGLNCWGLATDKLYPDLTEWKSTDGRTWRKA